MCRRVRVEGGRAGMLLGREAVARHAAAWGEVGWLGGRLAKLGG